MSRLQQQQLRLLQSCCRKRSRLSRLLSMLSIAAPPRRLVRSSESRWGHAVQPHKAYTSMSVV